MRDGGQRKRLQDGGVQTGEVAEGSKKRVFLEMTNLINMAFEDIKGPVMEVRSYLWGGGWQSVCVSFDAGKVPFQIISGTPHQGVAFCGSKFISKDEADHDAVIKVADYLLEKFGLRIADWSYEKAVRAELKCHEVVKSIQSSVANIKDIIGKWKSSVGLLEKLETSLVATPNPEHMALYGRLNSLKCTVKTAIQNFSDKISVTEDDHHLYLKEGGTNLSEDVFKLKISETDIINDILFGIGVKDADFLNILTEDHMFRGICKISLNGVVTSKTSGPTIIEGDVKKKTAYEAECSAAAKAINFLERSMGLEIIDVNFPYLRAKKQLLRLLQCEKNKLIGIEDQVATQWNSMILELKGMINECAFCNHEYLQDNGWIGCAQMLDDVLGDMNLLYDLATTNPEQYIS